MRPSENNVFEEALLDNFNYQLWIILAHRRLAQAVIGMIRVDGYIQSTGIHLETNLPRTRLVQRFRQGIPRQQFQAMTLHFAPRPEGEHQWFAVSRRVSELVIPG